MRRLILPLVLLTATLFVMSTELFAQVGDTLDVAPLPAGNLNTVINGDTLAGGVRAHPNRVYRLRHGAVYQVSEPMLINGSITIVANDTTPGLRPPVLAPQILSDNSSIDHFFDLNGKGGVVTIKNVYFLAIRSDGNALGWADGIRMNADSVKLTLQGDVFDGFTHTALMLAGQWNKLLVEDCVFRNEMHSSSYFGGGSLLSNYPVDMDTTIFVNNTFFCNNSYIWSIRGYCPNAVFSHNTLVYGTVNPFLMRQGQVMRIDNNIFYAMHAYGGIPEHVIQSWFLNYPDTASSSIIRLRAHDSTSFWRGVWGANITGPEVFIGTGGTGNATVTEAMVDPSKRFVDVRNNDNFWPKKMFDYYTQYNDTVKTADSVDMPDGSKKLLVRRLYLPTWMSDYTLYSIAVMDSNGAHVDTSGNKFVDPGFNTDIVNQFDKLLAYVGKIATNTLDSAWYYNPNGSLYPPVWPLPENLAYSNTSLQSAGTDGFALGDLNWFPTQKAAWLAAGGVALGVHKIPNEIAKKFDLSNNYPNPFNPSTNIKVSLVQSGVMSLKVYNILGQLVKVVDESYKQAGVYSYNVNMDNYASGVYFYTLQQGSNFMTKKMILLK
jgi:hypothetical protein